MKYLHKFATQTQFESYYNGENYEEPFVGFVAETSRVSYNKGSVPPPSPYLSMPLTVEVTAGSCGLQINKESLKYKINDGDWTITTGYGETINVSSGNVIQFKQNYEPHEGSGSLIPLFYETEDSEDFRFNIYGNVMSIYRENGFENLTEFTNEETAVFDNLFGYCNVVSAENLILPVTSLTDYCYDMMFNGCYSLTTAPELPATTLTDGCYRGMFYGCSSLTTAPELPATTLADYCYASMFQDCTSLTTAPELPVTTLANYCYQYMFNGCSSLTTAPELPATTLTENCYQQMFYNCTSLTTAPELPATTLANSCYNGMFQGCTSLTTAPVLPATILPGYCYAYMFKNCSSLNYIKCLAINKTGYDWTIGWVSGVSSTGTFVKNASMQWTTGNNGIPTGWTVQNVINY